MTCTPPEAPPAKYYGKYRGLVVNNVDPMQIGRLLVSCVDVGNGLPLGWAMPCMPIAGINMGMLSLPLPGSGVWVEFEQGDIDHPIWVGGYWGMAAEVPVMAHMVPPDVPGITLQTTLKNGLVISDTPGLGIMLQSMSGAMIVVNDIGIMISNGKGALVNLIGPSVSIQAPTVDINLGALTVV